METLLRVAHSHTHTHKKQIGKNNRHKNRSATGRSSSFDVVSYRKTNQSLSLLVLIGCFFFQTVFLFPSRLISLAVTMVFVLGL